MKTTTCATCGAKLQPGERCPSCTATPAEVAFGLAATEAETPAATSRPSAPQALAHGAMFGRFEVIDFIGRGGGGIVVSAYDPTLDRNVAIKFLHPMSPKAAEKARARLVREAQSMAKMSHPNVVTVHEVGVGQDQVFVVMELVEGKTLRAWMTSEERPWSDVLECFLKAGRGLSAAHHAGLIHRDFKPDNVLVSSDGRVLVTDFGLSAARERDGEEAGSSSPATAMRLTSDKVLLGTPMYMAPEQHERKELDARADQFAFAVSLYEALYAAHPFGGDTYAEVRDRVLSGKIREPKAKDAVPARIRAALVRAMSVDPAQRYPSIDDLLSALSPAPSSSRRRAPWVAAIVVALGVAVLGVARRPGPPRPCASAGDRLGGVWDSAVKSKVRERLLGTKDPSAEDVWRQVEAALDKRAAAWTAASTDSCEATHVRGEQSAELFALRARCLDRRLHEMGALTTLLSRDFNAAMSSRSAGAAHSLTPIERCADSAALTAALPLPPDPEMRSKIDAIRARLDDLEMSRLLGDASVEVATPLVMDARATGYPPAEAEALAALARVLRDSNQAKASEAAIRDAIAMAAKAKDDGLAARLWSVQLLVIGVDQRRPADALALRAVAEVAAERAGADTPDAADVHEAIGAVLRAKGEGDEATKVAARAAEIRQKWLLREQR